MNFELRIAGPDDVVTYDDELVALRNANAINKQYLADRAAHPEHEVLCVATVHAVDLVENLPELPTCTKSQTNEIERLRALAKDAYDAWQHDRDMRVGKLLLAMMDTKFSATYRPDLVPNAKVSEGENGK